MGLDMYFYASKSGNGDDKIELSYFRKHSDLHGWLEDLWREKGNEGDCNCKTFELDKDDIKRLEKFVNQENHPKREGFFWGSSEPEDWEQTKRLIPMLKEYMENGHHIIYWAWY